MVRRSTRRSRSRFTSHARSSSTSSQSPSSADDPLAVPRPPFLTRRISLCSRRIHPSVCLLRGIYHHPHHHMIPPALLISSASPATHTTHSSYSRSPTTSTLRIQLFSYRYPFLSPLGFSSVTCTIIITSLSRSCTFFHIHYLTLLVNTCHVPYLISGSFLFVSYLLLLLVPVVLHHPTLVPLGDSLVVAAALCNMTSVCNLVCDREVFDV